MRKLLILALFIASFSVLLLAYRGYAQVSGEQSKEKEVITYSGNTETSCKGGNCIATLYTWIIFPFDNATRTDEARTLKGSKYFSVEYIEKDEKLNLDVLDFNLTSMTVQTSVDDSLKGKDIPIEVLGDNATKVNLKFKGKDDKLIMSVPFSIGSALKFGESSTIVMIKANDTGVQIAEFSDSTYPTKTMAGSQAPTPANLGAPDGTCDSILTTGAAGRIGWIKLNYTLPAYQSINWINFTQKIWVRDFPSNMSVYNNTSGKYKLFNTSINGDTSPSCAKTIYQGRNINLTSSFTDYVDSNRVVSIVYFTRAATATNGGIFLDYAAIQISYELPAVASAPWTGISLIWPNNNRLWAYSIGNGVQCVWISPRNWKGVTS